MGESFYERLKLSRASAGQPESPALETVVGSTVAALISQETDARRPGMLLGKIQSGKTRAFLSVIAAAFDDGFDVAVVLTKGTKTLARQTVRRIGSEFQSFREAGELEVYDIMQIPFLSDYEIDEQKLIFVAKKEANNMRRLLKLFEETHLSLRSKRVLIVDDEADFASIRFTKPRDGEHLEQGRIADRIDELRRTLSRSAVLQVTATPYSLYLQPEDYDMPPGANFTFEPKRPAFTQLVPIHSGYVGGDHYFGDHEPNEPEYYLWHPVEDDELTALRKEDRRRVKRGQELTADKVQALRHALVAFVTGACIRRAQQHGDGLPQKRYAMIVHIETSKSAHSWQQTVVEEIVQALRQAIANSEAIVDSLIADGIGDLERSVKAEGCKMPPVPEIVAAVKSAFAKGAVVMEKVNSDNQVEALLDDNAELKLRTPFNIFIGGQILDRGITVPNLIGFYYGRSPKRMQQDTVLQHARMYGSRPRADLAVTRFYTTGHNFVALRRIHEFDSALRYAFETGAHDRGVAFIHRDAASRIVPCAPNKILASNIVSMRPGGGYLPFGFQTRAMSTIRPVVTKIDSLMPSAATGTKKPQKVSLETVIAILDLIEQTLEFDSGYSFDWEACRAALEYYSRIAAPDAEKGKCWVLAETGRTLRRIREGGRPSDAPQTYQDRQLARNIDGELPIMMFFRQEGRQEDDWRGYPFWWPVLFVPVKAVPSVFAATVREDDNDADD
jgi:hypothetical protein